MKYSRQGRHKGFDSNPDLEKKFLRLLRFLDVDPWLPDCQILLFTIKNVYKIHKLCYLCI